MINTSRLDELLDNFITMENGPVGCALSLSIHGESVYTGYKGFADVKINRPIDQDTVYRVFSCSKVVTATALMILVERGIIKLSDPVADYLPEYKNPVYCCYTGNNIETLKPAPALTVKHLITMTSGLTYQGDSNSTQRAVKKVMDDLESKGGFSTRDFAKRIAEVPLAFEPGTHWNYGVGHDVLGAVIEVASGKSYGDFLRDEIFEPLNMKNTGFFISDMNANNLAKLYTYKNGKVVQNIDRDYRFQKEYRFESGGGGLLSTLGDMSRFATMLSVGGTYEKKRIVGRKSIELMRQNHLCPSALSDFKNTHENKWDFMSGYGYGLGVKTLIDLPGTHCLGSIGEFSWAGAAGTFLLVDPLEEVAIAYMHQLMPENKEGECHPTIKNVIYGLL